MPKIIGIDLGTSNSAAAVMEGGKPTIIPSAEGTTLGGKAFPSYVAITKDSQLLVGEPARRQAVSNPEATLSAFKRKMGTDHKYKVLNKEYTPQQLSAFILQKVKKDAEAYLGDTIAKAVITVPAYFDDNQRQATKDAGAIAGLEVVRLVNEPTAACLAYGLDKSGQNQKIMVFDLGGGTLDVTLMDMSSTGKDATFEVVATSGDTQLGGTDMDNALIEYVAGEFRKGSGIDLMTDKLATTRLKEAVEKAKIELSSVMETEINLPFITADASGPKHLAQKLTRAKLEAIVSPIIDRCKGPVDRALNDSRNNPKHSWKAISDITKIIMVGGPTRMPIVQKFVEDYVGKKVEHGIDPMECVALGAAVQAAVLTGEVKDVLLLDVTPLTLGIETLGGVRTPLIDRNTTIPVKKSQIFSTAADNQPSVEVHVLQGERPMAKDNVSLGKFILDGIPPAPRGMPQVEVSFDLDANGILHVTAKDLGTNKEQSIRISSPSKLSKDDVEKFVKQAEQFAEEDKKNKEQIEAKNELDGLVYATEKSLKEHGDKASNDERLAIDRALAEAKEALKGTDVDAMKRTKESLMSVSHKLAEAIYKQAAEKSKGAAGAPPEGEAGASSGNGEAHQSQSGAVDAEIVDDEKK
ncbi:MAG: molecular chaperone DnaK [Elusimicrobiota bacterium]|jgi:molecular chaperone DnaK